MTKIIPSKLQKGNTIRAIAPSQSFSIISQETRDMAKSRFDDLGLELTFGEHINEKNDFASSSIESRIIDLHAAFSDKSVKAVLTIIGGFNSNQLLDYIDWNLIRNNPKILCGYSDITALNNSFFAKTGLVTYSGPHYSTFGQKLYFDYTLEYFGKCLMNKEPFEILRKLIKSFAVLRFFPSAIFNETETTALLSCCLRLYSSDFGNLSASA